MLRIFFYLKKWSLNKVNKDKWILYRCDIFYLVKWSILEIKRNVYKFLFLILWFRNLVFYEKINMIYYFLFIE